MSSRITKYDRKHLLQKVLIHRFRSQVEELASGYASLAETIRNDGFSAKELELLGKIPEGWLNLSRSIRCNFAGQSDHVNFNGERYDYYSTGPTGFPSWMYSDRVSVEKFVNPSQDRNFPSDHKFSIIREGLLQREMILKEEFKKARAIVEATLNSVTTFNKLVKEWPEMEPFIPSEEKVISLPSINVKQLNELLDLPVQESA